MISWLSAVFAAAIDVLRLDGGGAFVPPLGIAVGIAFVAGVSTLLGHGAVLYINRVTGVRGAAALALSGVFLVLLYVVHAVVLAIVAPVITGTSLRLSHVVAITLASTAPMILGVFEFVPVLGIVLGKALNVWSFVVLWSLISATYQTTWTRALLAGGVAWLVMHLLSSLLGPTVARVTGRIWGAVTGVPTQITTRDILAGTPMIPVTAQQVASVGKEAP